MYTSGIFCLVRFHIRTEHIKMTSSLPPNKRYIATHDANGKSVYAPSPDQVYRSAGNAGSIARSYSVANIPVEMGHEEDIKAYLAGPESVSSFQRPEIVVPTEGGKNFGSNLMVIDLKPGGYSGLHRTVSIDYSICVIGTIIHELDSGERVTLKPGVSDRCSALKSEAADRLSRITLSSEEQIIVGLMDQKLSRQDLSR